MRSPSRQARRAGVRSRLVALVGSVLLLAGLVPAATVVPVLASHTTAPTSVTIAGSLQSELGCSGGLAAGVRRDASHLRRDRHGLAGHVRGPVRGHGVRLQGGAQRRLDRELRRERDLQRRQHRPDGRRRQRHEVLLLARIRTGSRATGTRPSRRPPAASRARSAARATGSPTASGRGSRTRTATASTRSQRTRSRPATTR